MPKKKQPEKVSNKIVYIFFLVGLIVLILLGFLYYQSQRPNYRDLEKAFNQLDIPNDWQMVSKGGFSGWKGLFCFNAGIDEECPIFFAKFSKIEDIDSKQDTDLLGQIIEPTRFRVIEKNYDECNILAENYYCTVTTTSAGIKLTLSIRYEDGIKTLYVMLDR